MHSVHGLEKYYIYVINKKYKLNPFGSILGELRDNELLSSVPDRLVDSCKRSSINLVGWLQV